MDAELLFMSDVRIDERGHVGYEGEKILDTKLAAEDMELEEVGYQVERGQ